MSRNRFRVLAFLAVIAALSVIFVSSTQAGMVSFNMGAMFSWTGTPTYAPPWLNAKFVDVSPGQVELTISAIGLGLGEKIDGVYLNLDPVLNPFQLAFSAPTKTGTFANPIISHGTSSKPYDQYKADGDGKYDILIAFDTTTAGAFNGGEAVKYTITLASLTANSFDFLSKPAGGNGPFVTAAHILDTGGVSGTSAWVTTPEPATICILGLGALSLLRRRRA
jgi:hypothetical protein